MRAELHPQLILTQQQPCTGFTLQVHPSPKCLQSNAQTGTSSTLRTVTKQEIGYSLQELLKLIWVKFLGVKQADRQEAQEINEGKQELPALLAIVIELQKVLTSGSILVRYLFSPGSPSLLQRLQVVVLPLRSQSLIEIPSHTRITLSCFFLYLQQSQFQPDHFNECSLPPGWSRGQEAASSHKCLSS